MKIYIYIKKTFLQRFEMNAKVKNLRNSPAPPPLAQRTQIPDITGYKNTNNQQQLLHGK